MMRNKTGRLVTGLILGSLMGGTVGLVLAPLSGRKTREVVKHKTGHYVGALGETFGRCRASNGAEEHADTTWESPAKPVGQATIERGVRWHSNRSWEMHSQILGNHRA